MKLILWTAAAILASLSQMNLAKADHERWGSINAYRQFCYSDMCTYQIQWNTGWGNSSVVTVQIPGETPEKLMACEGAYGSAQAPWIAPGKTYIFRMYASTRCTADVGYYEYPAAQVNVIGGQ